LKIFQNSIRIFFTPVHRVSTQPTMVANPQTPDLLPFFFGNRTEILKKYQGVQ